MRFVISHINLRVKNGVFSKMCGRLMQKDSSVHTIRYNIYHMVGRSIASISDLGKYGGSGWIYRQWTSRPYDIYYISCIDN